MFALIRSFQLRYPPSSLSEKPENQDKARYGPSIRDYIIKTDTEEVADHLPQSWQAWSAIGYPGGLLRSQQAMTQWGVTVLEPVKTEVLKI